MQRIYPFKRKAPVGKEKWYEKLSLNYNSALRNELVAIDTESGFYTVSYILFAEADAPLEGSYRFKYQAPSTIAPENPTPQPTESHTPASSSWGTNVFVILLLVLAVGVTIGLSLYARKLFNNR